MKKGLDIVTDLAMLDVLNKRMEHDGYADVSKTLNTGSNPVARTKLNRRRLS